MQGVLGASEDGSRIYFAANGDLDGAGMAEAGNCEANSLLSASTGKCSLYLARKGRAWARASSRGWMRAERAT